MRSRLLLACALLTACLTAPARADSPARIHIEVQHDVSSLRGLRSREFVTRLAEGLDRKCVEPCLLTLRVSGAWAEIDRSAGNYREFLAAVRKAYCRQSAACALETQLVLIRIGEDS